MADSEQADAEQSVDVLLAAAGLDVPVKERQRLAQLYPSLRKSADRFYTVDVGDEVPAAIYRAGEVGT